MPPHSKARVYSFSVICILDKIFFFFKLELRWVSLVHCLKTSENVRLRAHRQMIWHSNAQRWLVLMFRVGKQISIFYALASFSQVVNNWMKKNISQNFFRSFFLSRIT
jgi:hypothetical protein